MHSCVACCLQSTSKSVCEQLHDFHCPDCNLYTPSCTLNKQELSTVCGDEATIRRIDSQHSARFLRSWAQHHRLKNYNRMTKQEVCTNIVKLINGDTTVLTSEKAPRRKRLRKLRPKRKKTDVPAAPSKVTIPLGYRSCVCGTKECKDTMFKYFREIHDYNWPEKYFPWIYVGVSSRPSRREQKQITNERDRARALKRDDKLHTATQFVLPTSTN